MATDLPKRDDVVWLLFEAHYNRRREDWHDGRPPFDPTRAGEWTAMADAVIALVAEYLQDTAMLLDDPATPPVPSQEEGGE